MYSIGVLIMFDGDLKLCERNLPKPCVVLLPLSIFVTLQHSDSVHVSLLEVVVPTISHQKSSLTKTCTCVRTYTTEFIHSLCLDVVSFLHKCLRNV